VIKLFDTIFEKFENEVMEIIISEDPSISELLGEQYKVAKVVNREFTGVGFFTTFYINDNSLRLPTTKNLTLGNVQARFKGLERGAGFVLFVNNGFINTLEGYTYEEDWPISIEGYTFYNV